MTEPAVGSSPPRGADRRTFVLVAVAVAVAFVTIVTWLAGEALDVPILAFAGLMVGATTFFPLPADTFVLAASAHGPAVVIGVIGGAITVAMVRIERAWVLVLVDHPWFDRFRQFFDTNRFVAWTERNMFVALLFGSATFVPYEPFRLIAILKNYPMSRYLLATFIGRGGRYTFLAWVGTELIEVGWLQQAIWLTLAMFVFSLWPSVRKLRRGPGP